MLKKWGPGPGSAEGPFPILFLSIYITSSALRFGLKRTRRIGACSGAPPKSRLLKAVLTQGLAGRRPSKQGSDLTYSGALIPQSTAISPGCAVQSEGPRWPLAGPRASLRNEGTSIAAEPRPSATPTPRGRRLRGSPWRPPHRTRPRPPGTSLFPPPTGRRRKKPATGRGEARPPPPRENTEAPRGGTSGESCRDGGSGSSRRRAAWRPERGRAREGRAGRSDRRREATMEARGQPQSPAA